MAIPKNYHCIGARLKAVGELQIIVHGPDGAVKEQRFLKNLVVSGGLGFLANAIIAASASPMTAMAVGTGTAAPALANTALQTETFRAAFTSSGVAGPVTTMTLVIPPASATGAITEAGLFNQLTLGGLMLSRVVFAAVNKAAADTLTITWTVTLS